MDYDFQLVDRTLADARRSVMAELERIFAERRRTGYGPLYDLLADYPCREGKGLRPAICLASCRAMGGRTEQAILSATALELFHNAFLVHDDVEDGSEFRRGKPTMLQLKGASISINVGDATNVLAMPFLFRSIEHLRKVLDGPLGEEILNSFEPLGFVGLAFYDSGARSIYNSVRPIRSIADLKGLRIRVQQSQLMSDMMQALGAEPIPLPYGQVRTGLATRLIDRAENNWPSFVTTDHHKYVGFYTLTDPTMGPEVLVMSRKAWNSLLVEDQAIFRDATLQSSHFMRERWKDREEKSRRQAEAAGVTIVTDFDRKPFEATMQPIYARMTSDPATAGLIERIRKVN